jgi:hypothetical protein
VLERLLPALLIAVVVVGAVVVLQRRSAPPTRPQAGYRIPTDVDRRDFPQPETPWLVAVFSSRTCDTCAGVLARVAPLESDQVVVCDVEVSEVPELHARYGIDSVPITVIVDAEGVVVDSFAGPVSSTHLWAAVAEAREPGSTPADCAHPELDDLESD